MENNIETTKANLVTDYVNLLKRGLPERSVAELWGRVEQLPDEDQAEVRGLIETARALKKTLETKNNGYNR